MIAAVESKSDFEETLQKARTMLVFKIENQSYALSIEHVAQIIPMLRLTPVPQVDRMIEGVANIHGAVVPVISARRYLGMPYQEPGLYTPIVLTRVGERLIGLIVDEVKDVITVPGRQVVSPKDILPEGINNSPIMSGVVYQQDQSILLLEPRHLLRPTQVRTLNRAVVEMQDSFSEAQADQETLVDQPAFDAMRAVLAEKRTPTAQGNGKSEPKPEEIGNIIDTPSVLPVVSTDLPGNGSHASNGSQEKTTAAENENAVEKPQEAEKGRKKKRKNAQPKAEQSPDQNNGDATV